MVSQEGDNPSVPSAWEFLIRGPDNFGAPLHGESGKGEGLLTCQFDSQGGSEIKRVVPKGRVKLATLTATQLQGAREIIGSVEGPKPGGVKEYQNWVYNRVMALQNEGIVEYGTSDFVRSLIGMPAKEVAEAAKEKWIAG